MSLEQENKILRLLLEWAIECDFGLDNIMADDEVNIDFDDEKYDDYGYIDLMMEYAAAWLDARDKEILDGDGSHFRA